MAVINVDTIVIEDVSEFINKALAGCLNTKSFFDFNDIVGGC